MGDLHLFLSKQAHASIAKSNALHDAVLALAGTIESIAATEGERDELARDAKWLLAEIMADRDSSNGGA